MKALSFSDLLFSDVVALVLPSAEQTLMLRACLQPESQARQAWQQWQDYRDGSGKSAISDTLGVKIIAPLLFNAVRGHGFEIDKDSQTFLRSAYAREEMRNKIFRRICHDVLLAFEKAGLPAIVLKGAALAETVYGNPVLRHCHDIDILLPAAEMSRAALLLQSLNFRVTHRGIQAKTGHVRLEHESGLPLELHSRLFQVPYYDPSLGEIRARSQSRSIADVGAQILSPVDGLLHVCGHASYSRSGRLLRWVSDAWFIIDRHADLDWDLLLHCARQSRMVLPLYVALGYLARDLEAPIPANFLTRLEEDNDRADTLGREVLVRQALSILPGGVVTLIRHAKDWRERYFLIRWLLLPSPGYLFRVDQVTRSWLLPLHYVYRPIRFLVRYFWFTARRYTRQLLGSLTAERTESST